MTKEIDAIAILLKDGSVYLQRLAPTTASEDSLTSQEKVIIELYYQLQESQQQQKGVLVKRKSSKVPITSPNL